MSESSDLLVAVREAVTRRTDELYDLLGDLVRQQTLLGREEGGQRIVEERLRRLGFSVERLELSDAGSRDDYWAGYGGSNPRGTCVAGRLAGTGGGRSLHFSGHMDVVPVEAPEQWTHDPWGAEVADDRLWGRGAGDMKAGLAAYLVAAEAVLEVIGRPRGDLCFTSVIEEENGGNGMRAVLDAGYDADATLIGEPTGLELLHAGIGIVWAQLTAYGAGAHAATADAATSPIEQLMAAIEGLRELEAEVNEAAPGSVYAKVSPHPYNLNLGEIHAGAWASSVPVKGTLRARLGFGPELDPAAARERIRAAVHRHAPNVVVAFQGFAATAYCHDLANPLVALIDETHAALFGDPPGRRVLTATTDARFVTGPCVCYGPLAGNYHGTDEWVDLESVRDTALGAAVIAGRWLGSPVDTRQAGGGK